MGKSATTYSAKWKLQPTKLIRVPQAIADETLAYARYLDNQKHKHQEIRNNSVDYELKSLDSTPDLQKPINIASVPLRSPFRYPGGKTWLVPYIRSWLQKKKTAPSLFIEPFAGGGICGLTAAFDNLTNYVLLAELDENVASVWKAILNGQAEWLARRILEFDMTMDNIKNTLHGSQENSLSLKERAFRTILRNRVQRGGIMAPGAGLIKKGENGRGIISRWYPSTLARRIREIGWCRHFIGFYDGDGFDLIQEYQDDEDCVFFADPPYTKAAKRLYQHWHFDHRKLFDALSSCRGDFLISYDNTEQIKEMAAEYGLAAKTITMKNSHHAKMNELLIGRDLDWLNPL